MTIGANSFGIAVAIFILGAIIMPTAAQPAADQGYYRVAMILRNNCGGCHSWADQSEGIRSMVVPGQPDQSPIVRMVETDAMPPSGAPLTDDEKSAIYDWIKAGATIPSDSSNLGGVIPAVGALPSPPSSIPPINYHMVSGFLASGFLLAAGAIGAWRLVDLMQGGHSYRDSIGFTEGTVDPNLLAKQQGDIAALWLDPQGQVIRWTHVALIATGTAFYVYNAITGLGMLTPKDSTLTKRDLHRWAFFAHLGLMSTEIALGFVTSDALKRGDHRLVSTLAPIHAAVGVATPLAILGSGLIISLKL